MNKNAILQKLAEKTAPSPTAPFKSIVGEPMRLLRITGPHKPLPTTLNQKQPFYTLEVVDEAGAVFIVWSAHTALVKYWEDDDLRRMLRTGETITFRVDGGVTKKGTPVYTLTLLDALEPEEDEADA